MLLTEIVSTSKEFIKVAVTATKNGVAYDPTSKTVDFAFCDADEADHPTLSTWYGGSWQTVGGVHYAECLVNDTSGFDPAPGKSYGVFVRVTDNPEIPVKYAGLLKVR